MGVLVDTSNAGWRETPRPPAGRGTTRLAAGERIGALYLTDGNRDDLTYSSALALARAHAAPIDIHVLQHGYSAAPPAAVAGRVREAGHDLEIHRFDPIDRGLRGHGHITATAYSKVDAIQLLSDRYEFLLYLDTDTLAVNFLNLYKYTPKIFPLAAVSDMWIETGLDSADFQENCRKHGLSTKYFNSGVLFVNTSLWRMRSISDRYELYVTSHANFCPYRDGPCPDIDQCALNLAVSGDWQSLPLELNVQKAAFQTGLWDTAVIRHYTGPKKFLPVVAHRADRIERAVLSRVASDCPDLGLRLPGPLASLAYGFNRLRRTRHRRRFAARIEARSTSVARIGTRNADAGAEAQECAPQRVAKANDRQLTVALFGLFGIGNIGNEGSLEAMVEWLRRALPSARLHCVCRHPEIVNATFGLAATPLRPVAPPLASGGTARRALARAHALVKGIVDPFVRVGAFDAIVVPGTGILDDFGDRPRGMPFRLLLWCLAARVRRVPFAFVSVGAGPINHPTSRRLMTLAARLAGSRTFRDAISRDFMQGLGLDTACDAVYPDIVFALAEPEERSRVGEGPLCVGLGVMDYHGWYGYAAEGEAIHRAYLDKLLEFVGSLLEQGCRVRLLTGDLGDAPVVDRVLAEASRCWPAARHRIEGTGSRTLRELMAAMADTDLVVATRFHNVVCALKMGKPTISLGYAAKNDVLMEEMGLGEFCQHVERFEVETLLAQFHRLVAGREAYAATVRARVAEAKRRLAEQEQLLLAWLDGRGS